MSRKTAVDLNNKTIETRFATWIRIVIDLISPKNLWLIAGRGTSKTSDILAERFMDVCYDMPGAYFALVADTYVNAKKNILDALLEGLNRKGWIEGIHYVIDEEPPAHFDRPYKAPQQYKHTISVFNGCFVNLISMDQPSGAAGNSYQHIFGDETKYLQFDKIKKLTPALRGYKKFTHSVYYCGNTFTTDMPNASEGEHDWILDREKEMNVKQCQDALRVGFVLNELRIELINEEKAGNKIKVNSLKKQIERWEKRHIKVRKNSTFFKRVSSYANADFLNVNWFEDTLNALGKEEFKTAVATFPSTLKKGEQFYYNLGEHHFYDDGIITDYYKNYSLKEDWVETSLAQRYIHHSKPIEVGQDFGNMMSMVTGQTINNTTYLFKEFFTLPPDNLRQLADQVLEFYSGHKCKKFIIWHDRSGNAYGSIGKDQASELKAYLEKYIDGKKTGWEVELMNKGQQTILQQEEYKLANNILSGENPKLPRIKICSFGCRNLKSSMQKAKTKVSIDKNGIKYTGKDKASEKLPFHKLPSQSTNLPDAFKYFIFRVEWVKISKQKRVSTASMAPEVVGE